jgi:hypothetical protein
MSLELSENGAPALSVVIPSVNGWPDLDRCLAALEGERTNTTIEALVPERCGAQVRESLARTYPWARVLPVSTHTTIPQMRAIAFREAAAPTVAVIEDHVIVPPGWARAMLAARSNGARVVGGGLVNAATETVVDWAAWLCEYNHLAAPMPSGQVDGIHGNHTAYDRALLTELREVVDSGRWEDALHAAIRARGISLWARPDIVAGHRKHYTVREYATQRFLYSRAYAAMRTHGAPLARRVVYGAMAFALPPVLFLRIVSRVWRGGLYRRHLAPSLPLLALFVFAWGLGEVAGAWFGDGGALAKVA